MSWCGIKHFIPVYIEDSIFNFYLSKEVQSTENNVVGNSVARKRVWESGALVSPTKTLNTDLTTIGDDLEQVEALREDVEIGNDEDEEPLEAEVPKIGFQNPSSRDART